MAEETKFQGDVSQLAFDQLSGGFTAVLKNSQDSVTVSTIELRMQSLLEVAMLKSATVSIAYEEGAVNTLRTVSLDNG